jgi:hypothetical protein
VGAVRKRLPDCILEGSLVGGSKTGLKNMGIGTLFFLSQDFMNLSSPHVTLLTNV